MQWARTRKTAQGLAQRSRIILACARGGSNTEIAAQLRLMLLARTGRRVSEICMLDHDPLLPLHQSRTSSADDPEAFVTRLRYQ